MDMLNVTGYQRRPPLLVGEYKGFFAKEGLEVTRSSVEQIMM